MAILLESVHSQICLSFAEINICHQQTENWREEWCASDSNFLIWRKITACIKNNTFPLLKICNRSYKNHNILHMILWWRATIDFKLRLSYTIGNIVRRVSWSQEQQEMPRTAALTSQWEVVTNANFQPYPDLLNQKLLEWSTRSVIQEAL